MFTRKLSLWLTVTLIGFLAACSTYPVPEADNTELESQAVSASTWVSHYTNTQNWHTAPYYYETVTVTDISQDGRADVCGRSMYGLECFFSNGSSFTFFTRFSSLFPNSGNWHSNPSYWSTIQYADVDHDRRTDVCARGKDGIYCAMGNTSNTGFGSLVKRTSDFSDAQGWGSSPSYWQTIQLADVDGDGDAEICGRGSAGIYCARYRNFGFDQATLWTSNFSNADNWNTHDYYYATLRFVDVNGDKKADVCGRGSAGIYCALSTGTSFGPARPFTSQFSNASNWHSNPAYWTTISYADINGDGKADVCGRGGAGMYCGLSTGSSFTGAFSLNVPQFSDTNSWNQAKYYETIQLADVNGDNKADICGRGMAGIYCAHSTSSTTTVSFAPLYLRVDNFRDRDGWGSTPAYWRTIQAANIDGRPGLEFCGRGTNGIVCSSD